MSNVLVTGSSRGLGLELVKQLAAHPDLNGGLVLATARRCSSELQTVISTAKGSIVFVTLDVTDQGVIMQSAEKVKSALAGRSLDILINCAGVHNETHGKIALMLCSLPGLQDQQSSFEYFDGTICSWLQSDMGGQDADLTVPQGAEAVLNIVMAASGRDNGSFKNVHVPGWEVYDGKRHARTARMPVWNADACAMDGHLGRELVRGLLGFTPPGRATRGDSLDGRATPSKRQRGDHDQQHPVERSPIPAALSTTSDGGSNYHALQAKGVIQIDLHNPSCIGRERQALLKSALHLVSSIAETGPHHSEIAMEEESHPQNYALTVPETPSRELLFMLLPGPPESVRIQWPDHISDKTYARMASALLRDRSEIEVCKFHQYCVCVYVKAVFHLYQASGTTDDPFLKGEFSLSRSTYIAAAMRSIEHFNILKPPDLSAIQSLISSALLMQHLGRPNQCWLFISYAARQITALNYHRIRRLPTNSDQEQEIHNVLYWCYYLDRTLSSLLCRPPSLPDLDVSPTELIVLHPSSPYDSLLRLLLDLAQVQGKLHAVSCGGASVTKERALDTCQLLECKMQAILPTLQSVSDLMQSRDGHPKLMQYHWVAVDFCYYAIFVEIHRTRLQSAFNPAVHQQCLLYARKSLKAFHFLQQHSVEMPGFDDPYPSFLTCAFFVIFCNIIGTVDHEDYELMRQITQRLTPFKEDPHLGKLLNLLQSLERLCEPLFQEPSGPSEFASTQREAPGAFVPMSDHSADPVTIGAFPPGLSFSDNLELMPNTETDLSADLLMWQLFNSQVPAGWLNKDIDSFGV
ncbi:hypothetical protein ASPWEDRAFT_114522 [Aspergillus wentii DTO 134E9]|uniref:Xylanolytic transcriptional activator regulatory domain-containing protein n=1 Tax=Aspergillus wentii DTO 134E9 TaxID=1073089 RepID=A0A1L9RF88_ASPWE|nr:uncharacterized protein ASPWEDRAFT_114522 [Aspergillus wentii DTO 134E9]OJJ33537.1 hypothetical protein ASPWEDRAFT_114522 [Aspergillus wentii DTO 134E9]